RHGPDGSRAARGRGTVVAPPERRGRGFGRPDARRWSAAPALRRRDPRAHGARIAGVVVARAPRRAPHARGARRGAGRALRRGSGRRAVRAARGGPQPPRTRQAAGRRRLAHEGTLSPRPSGKARRGPLPSSLRSAARFARGESIFSLQSRSYPATVPTSTMGPVGDGEPAAGSTDTANAVTSPGRSTRAARRASEPSGPT